MKLEEAAGLRRGEMIGLFKRTRAPDELYFPTLLSLLGVLPCVEQALDNETAEAAGALAALAPEVCGKRLTYCDWSGLSPKSPADLELSREVVGHARAEGAIFARKFRGAEYVAWCALVGVSEMAGASEKEAPRAAAAEAAESSAAAPEKRRRSHSLSRNDGSRDRRRSRSSDNRRRRTRSRSFEHRGGGEEQKRHVERY